jgi:hypothetical protein
MKTGTFAIAVMVASAVVVLGSATAEAQHHRRGHYDWHPGQLRFHHGHIDYLPGHLDFHSTGHLDYHRGGHYVAGQHRANRYPGRHYAGTHYRASRNDRGHYRGGHSYGRYQRD